jgi:hypothetical protein
MSRTSTTTRFDRYLHKAKDHPALSIVLFLGFSALLLINFWEKIERYAPWKAHAESPHIAGAIQEGDITVTGLYAYDIYYPGRYISPPNLVFPDGYRSVENFELIEQRADGFRVSLGGSGIIGAKIKWKAVGTLESPSQ